MADPVWTGLTAASVIGGVFMILFVTIAFKYTKLKTRFGVVEENGVEKVVKFIWLVITEVVKYIPHALVLFGFIRDTIYEEFRYSVVSLTGIASVFANALVGLGLVNWVYNQPSVMTGGGDDGYTWFKYLDSCFSPQVLVLTASMVSFLLIDFGTTRPFQENVPLLASSLSVLAVQGIIMWANGSFSEYHYVQKGWTAAPFVTWLIGILTGGVMGVSGYYITNAIRPDVLPSRESMNLTPNGFNPKTLSALAPPTGPPETIINVGEKSSAEQSLPVNDQDQFVCEAYKDGELVTSTIVE